jgi:site-specific recombinase XerD
MNFGLYKRNKHWHYSFYINKKRYRGSTGTETKDLALKFAQKIYNEIYQNKHGIKNNVKVNLDDLINEYITVNKNIFSKDWLEYKQWTLKKFVNYMSSQNVQYLNDISVPHLEHYKAFLFESLKPHTVKNILTMIGTLFNFAINLGYTHNNPVKKLTPIRGIQKNKQRFLSKEEIEKVIKATKNTYFEKLVLTALYTGMRRRELINLEYHDIDHDKKLIHVRNKENFKTKSRKERIIPLHQNLFSIFEKDKTGYCFLYKNKIIHEDRVSRDFQDSVNKVGLTDVGLHILRHTFVSQCLMVGISIWEVAKWVGHSTTHVTELYGHLCPERREIDKLNI